MLTSNQQVKQNEHLHAKDGKFNPWEDQSKYSLQQSYEM